MMVIIAFLLAPLATPITIWAVFSVSYLLGVGWFADKTYALVFDNVLAYSIVATPLAYVVTLIGGWPRFKLLRRRGRLGLLHFVALGAVLGFLPFTIVDGVMSVRELWRGDYAIAVPFELMHIVLSTLCGVSSAAVFWTLGVRTKAQTLVERLKIG
jgi:hypothetical protein